VASAHDGERNLTVYDDRDLARGVRFGVPRNASVLKIALVVAMIGAASLLMLAPFGAVGDRASARCQPSWPGSAGDPRTDPGMRAKQVAFAKLIDEIAVARGLPGRATLIALMTALQESQLLNLDYGDRDSIGLFQQRPSAGWGTVTQILDPRYAANAFFGGSEPPTPPGLVDIDNWPSMTYTEAAQAVQVSAFPDAYARHEQTARAIADEAGIDLQRTGDPYAGRAGARPGAPSGDVSAADDCGNGETLYAGKPINGVWPLQTATVSDPTQTGGMVTPRTALWVKAARESLNKPPMTCWDPHLWNARSDHPKGRACDVMIGRDARGSTVARAEGDRIASWSVRTAAQTGVNYVIWYGQIWTASTGRWKTYVSGVYDTKDATGGHYDHVHVSLY
jgi:hypothetical protein